MVFDPLGMTSSSYVWQEKYETLKTFSHNSLGEPSGWNKPTQANAAATLNTTVEDYGRFVSAILKGEGLKKETFKQMLRSQIKVSESGTNNTKSAPEKLSSTISWGLGLGLQTTSYGLSFWHWGDNGDCKAFVAAFEKQNLEWSYSLTASQVCQSRLKLLTWLSVGTSPSWGLKYDSYKSARGVLIKNSFSKGVDAALSEYNKWREGPVGEESMNEIGYALLRSKRVKDAIEIFKQNVSDYPQSANVFDSLGEAYMVNGDRGLAIKNYERSVELAPDNKKGIEALKRLRDNKQ